MQNKKGYVLWVLFKSVYLSPSYEASKKCCCDLKLHLWDELTVTRPHWGPKAVHLAKIVFPGPRCCQLFQAVPPLGAGQAEMEDHNPKLPLQYVRYKLWDKDHTVPAQHQSTAQTGAVITGDPAKPTLGLNLMI